MGHVEAARILGGQPFVPGWTKLGNYLIKLGLATHQPKLVSYSLTWPPSEQKGT